MKYTTLGNTGIEVSRLGFGAMRPPMLEGGKWDTDNFIDVMRRGFDLGVNYVDTAHVYGDGLSEEHVAKAIKGRRDELTIATKIPLGWQEALTPDQWQEKLELSLKRLETEIDVCFFHDLSAKRFDGEHFDGIVEKATAAKERGDIKHIAVSTHASVEDVMRFIDSGIYEVILMQYNILNLNYAPCFEHAKSKGLGTVVMGPVAGGVLAMDSETLGDMSPVEVKNNAEFAFRFALANKNADVLISGMNTIEMVEENAASASLDISLSDEQEKAIKEEIEKKLGQVKKICTACGYCKPCPQDIDIPAIFRCLTQREVWGFEKRAQNMFDNLIKNEKTKPASSCVECGECEVKCPQKIEIRKQMDRCAGIFEK